MYNITEYCGEIKPVKDRPTLSKTSVSHETKGIEVVSNFDMIKSSNIRKGVVEIKRKFGKRILDSYVAGCVNAENLITY